MGIREWWQRRRTAALFERHAAEVLAAAREDDAEEIRRAIERALELGRRERHDDAAERAEYGWNGPTRINGLPLLTYGQRCRYGAGRAVRW